LGAGCLLLALTRSIAAFAADTVERPALRYEAPPECPSLTAFEARSKESLRRLGADTRIAIALSAHERGFQGEIELVDMRAARWARSIFGADCGEVVSAIALSLAIHLDGSNAGSVAPAPQMSEAAESVVDRAPASEPFAAQAGTHWYFAVEAGGGVRTGLGESFDPSLRGGIEASSSGAYLQSYRLGFELGVGAAQQLSPELAAQRWDHRWWTANAQVCPWGYALLPGLDLQPCLAGHLGRYSAELTGSATRSSWLGFVELAARLRARLGRWSLSGEFGAFLPVAPLGLERQGEILFRQELGLVGGLTLAYAPFALKDE
jgi:hypothetical protein